jgi:RNase P subunit RPR2
MHRSLKRTIGLLNVFVAVTGKLLACSLHAGNSEGYCSDIEMVDSDEEAVDGWRPRGWLAFKEAKQQTAIQRAITADREERARPTTPTLGVSGQSVPAGQVKFSDLALESESDHDSDPDFQLDSSDDDDQPGAGGVTTRQTIGSSDVIIPKAVLTALHDKQYELSRLYSKYLNPDQESKGLRPARVEPVLTLPSKEAGMLKCTECPRIFATNQKMRRHFRQRHQGEGVHVCSICQKKLGTPGALRIHSLQHAQAKPHVCDQCDRSYSTSKALKAHVREKHSLTSSYTCKFCAKEFKIEKTGKEHEAGACTKKPGFEFSRCPYCDKMFVRARDRNYHVKRFHQAQ